MGKLRVREWVGVWGGVQGVGCGTKPQHSVVTILVVTLLLPLCQLGRHHNIRRATTTTAGRCWGGVAPAAAARGSFPRHHQSYPSPSHCPPMTDRSALSLLNPGSSHRVTGDQSPADLPPNRPQLPRHDTPRHAIQSTEPPRRFKTTARLVHATETPPPPTPHLPLPGAPPAPLASAQRPSAAPPGYPRSPASRPWRRASRKPSW